MSILKATKVSRTCTVTITKTKMMMRRPSDARKKEGRGDLRRILIMSMKSSSQISNLELGNRQIVKLVDRVMLLNKISKVMGSILILSGTMGRKTKVMGWNFMVKMCM